MNILFFCNRSSRSGVLGPRKWFGIVSGLPRDRFDYVLITCRLRLVYVSFTCLTRIKQVKNGCVHRAIPEETSKKSRTNLEPFFGKMVPKMG